MLEKMTLRQIKREKRRERESEKQQVRVIEMYVRASQLKKKK